MSCGGAANRASSQGAERSTPDEAHQTLAIEVSDVGSDHVVRLTGELDIAEADRVRAVLIGASGSTVMVDLSGLSFIDARGLSALVGAKRAVEEAGNELRCTGARGIVRRVIEITDPVTDLLGE